MDKHLILLGPQCCIIVHRRAVSMDYNLKNICELFIIFLMPLKQHLYEFISVRFCAPTTS